MNQEELVVEALRRVDLSSLRGAVVAKDAACGKYFGHFCALLHLEYFTEVASVRRRISKRSGEELQRGGWALCGLEAQAVKGKGKGKEGKGKEKGKEGKGRREGFQITLKMPSKAMVDVERLRFKRGDSVILSATHPLRDRVGEGQVADLNGSIIVVVVEGAEAPQKGSTWRVDKGSNRLSYMRQLNSLVSLCHSEGKIARWEQEMRCVSPARPKVFDILTSAKVGDVDAWTAKWSEQAELPPEPVGLALGDVVRLRGLQSEALNGQEGEVVSLGERVFVKLKDSVKSVSLEHVEQVPKAPKAVEKEAPAALAAEALPCDDLKLSKMREELQALPCTESQKEAIGATFQRRCTIIQGPPGTGKTTTAVEVLRSWAELGLKPLLAVADGNIAVDNIAAGLAKYGKRVQTVRVGRPEKIRPELEELTLDSRCKVRKLELQAWQ